MTMAASTSPFSRSNVASWKCASAILGESSVALRKQAIALLGQPGKAIACFRKATELSPNMAEAHFQLATLLREKGDVDAAIVIYQRVLAIDPRYAPALNDLGAV